ncbi:MAG TPA: thioesterase family protein [Solirubrobacteraceae bacterium]|nr:thioesterase family protein [Solirubrobacteraceae bacterium]
MNATIVPDATGFAGAHGGYLMSLALEAMAGAVGDPQRRPRSLTMHLLAPVAPGPVELEPRVERAGGTMTSVSLRLLQEGATVGTALGAFGRARPSLERSDASMPAVPPPEQLAPLAAPPVPQATLHVEHRPAAGPLPLSGGDRAELVVWVRLADDRPVDPPAATFLADAAAPALYAVLTDYVAMPSADVTLHFAPGPPPDDPWVLLAVRSRFAAEGYALEDGELWARDGRLLLRSGQLRRVLAPR